jgi:L-lactate dehydrogenase complex protein LldG
VSDRDEILARIRGGVAHATPHPGVYPGTALPASVEAFAGALRRAGGELVGPAPREGLRTALLGCARGVAPGGRVVAEPGAAGILGPGAYEVAAPDAPPHAFADVEVAVALGAVGVAESGAVAVLGRDAPHRSLLVLAERLFLLLYAGRLVGDLHAGMRALPGSALDSHHLTWIAGPSKSADIEQTLVLGAHGPRELRVFLYS